MASTQQLLLGEGAGSREVLGIEDVFSVWLRTGTGSSQTVTTGIKENTGALVISKARSAATDWAWYDTFRGATKDLVSNSTAAQTTQAQGLTSFNADGHTWGTLAKVNTSGATYVDTVLKPTPKFFDIQTWTGNSTVRTISHNLGSVPGMIIVKRTDAANDWNIYHRSLGATKFMRLNTAQSVFTSSTRWNDTEPTSTVFSLGTEEGVNFNGGTYVAYIFAHDAGGFGLTGTDNVISCGSYTTDGSGNATVSLGYEPQWVLYKPSSAVNNWKIFDNMRGMVVGSGDQALHPNTSGAEAQDDSIQPSATGFSIVGGNASATHIYIAIRRGPMKVPTDATKVFLPIKTASPVTGTVSTTGFPVDLQITAFTTTPSAPASKPVMDRLRGVATTTTEVGSYLTTTATSAESAAAGSFTRAWNNTGYQQASLYNGASGVVFYNFRRAPSFFDVVCYTGTGTAGLTLTHNLKAVPELMIVKSRSGKANWAVYSQTTGNTNYQLLNLTNATAASSAYWNNTSPTSTTFTVGTGVAINSSGGTFVAYLFATCPGVSKVGSYTGTGTTKQIDCGFAAGARFVLIKRTDSTGDWYVWDSARGIVSGNDPYLLLNSTAAETTNRDYIDAYSAGFELSSTAPAAINASGGTFIFLAIA